MKIKTIIMATVLYLLWNALVYSAISFYELEINPAKWDEFYRMLFISFGWLWGLFIYSFASTRKEIK